MLGDLRAGARAGRGVVGGHNRPGARVKEAQLRRGRASDWGYTLGPTLCAEGTRLGRSIAEEGRVSRRIEGDTPGPDVLEKEPAPR